MTTQRHEIEAWLGADNAGLTREQVDQLVKISDQIAADIDPDLPEEREAALTAAVQYMLGETTLAEAGRKRAAARAAVADATTALRQLVIIAYASGQSERSIVEETGIARETVRAWLGK